MFLPVSAVSLRGVSATVGCSGAVLIGFRGGRDVKRPEEIMEILEAFDLTGGYRAAAELAGVDHHTVAHYVALREAGRGPERMRAERVADPFLAKIEEWVERSRGRVGADVCHRKLQPIPYLNTIMTTSMRVSPKAGARLEVSAADLHVGLDDAGRGQQRQRLLVSVQAVDPVGEQARQPPRLLGLDHRHVADPFLEVLAAGVDRAEHDLVAQHEVEVDRVGGDIAAAHAAVTLASTRIPLRATVWHMASNTIGE